MLFFREGREEGRKEGRKERKKHKHSSAKSETPCPHLIRGRESRQFSLKIQ
jgi:hypothetical protein